MDAPLVTRITRVTVYPDQAQVTRSGELAVDAAGTHTIRIGGLPLSLQRESLRVAGRGPAGTHLLGIEQASEFHAGAPEETRRSLEAEIQRLEQALALLEERRAVLAEQQRWLGMLAEQTARSLAWGMARGSARAEDATAFFASTAGEAQRIAAARLDAERERDETTRTLEALRRERDQLGRHQPDRLAAVVRLETAAPGAVTLDLSYVVDGAAWRPRYDARVDAAGTAIRLTQQALVTQRTSEAWEQVRLTLSTARPSAAQRLPDEPEPWYVDVHTPAPVSPPMPRRMASAPLAGQARGLDVAFSAARQELAELELAPAEAERSGAAQLFHVAGNVDVPSDGSPHTLTIGSYELPCQLDYVAMPAVAAGAHRRARARNTTAQVLLPGELHVFHAGASGDEYAGATQLELTAENAELLLYLGVDDNLPVKREIIERDTDRGNLLLGGLRRVTYGYRVTLTNRTEAPQRVTLKDTLPVPRNERIKVKVLDLRPQPTAHTRLEQLAWELHLEPGEERRIEWRFMVEAPADVQLSGLP
jgi:uncharacterized protein (TIGR02231 family)